MTEWVTAAASVVGTGHLRVGQPCQDEHRVSIVRNSHGDPALFACVSDGAGSAVEGKQGADLVCRTWYKRMLGHHKYGGVSAHYPSTGGTEWLVETCKLIRVQAVRRRLTLSDFACTFLGAYVRPRSATFFQIGDGVIVTQIKGEDVYQPVFWPDQGAYVNATSFVTDNDVFERLQQWTFGQSMGRVALMSDGLQRLALDYETKTAFAPFFDSMFSHLASADPDDSAKLSENLAMFLDSDAVNERTNDDKTLVLARLTG